MKKITTILLFIGISIFSYSQPIKKPVIMFIPSSTWAEDKGYLIGDEEIDFEKVKTDDDWKAVNAKIISMLMDRGYPQDRIKDLETTLAKAKTNYVKKKSKGKATSFSDELGKAANAEIQVKVTARNIAKGRLNQFQLTLEPMEVGTGSPAGTPTTGYGEGDGQTPIPILVEEALIQIMEPMLDGFTNYMTDMFEKGRGCLLIIDKLEEFEDDFYDVEIEGEMLYDYVEAWLEENAKNGDFNNDLDEGGEQNWNFKAPVFDERDKPIDARKFVKPLYDRIRDAGFDLKLQKEGVNIAIITFEEYIE
jgi:hypothetical protein